MRSAIKLLLPVVIWGSVFCTSPKSSYAEPLSFSIGPLAGQYYRYNSEDAWLVNQGAISIGGAAYVELLRRSLDLRVGDLDPGGAGSEIVLRTLTFWQAVPTDLDVNLTGAGLSVDIGQYQAGLAWAWDTGCPFQYANCHGIISTIGLSFEVLP